MSLGMILASWKARFPAITVASSVVRSRRSWRARKSLAWPDPAIRIGVSLNFRARAADDHDVVHAGGDREAGLQQGDRAARAAAFHADRRQVHVREARVVSDERGHMFLVDELPRGHVADVHGVDVLGPELRVLDRLQAGLDPEVPERSVPELAELRLADANHRDVPHGQASRIRIFPRYFAYVA